MARRGAYSKEAQAADAARMKELMAQAKAKAGTTAAATPAPANSPKVVEVAKPSGRRAKIQTYWQSSYRPRCEDCGSRMVRQKAPLTGWHCYECMG